MVKAAGEMPPLDGLRDVDDVPHVARRLVVMAGERRREKAPAMRLRGVLREQRARRADQEIRHARAEGDAAEEERLLERGRDGDPVAHSLDHRGEAAEAE